MHDEVEFDAVRLGVMWTRLRSIANEQARTVIRAAFSTILRETEDISCGIFDTNGNMIVQAETGTPGHINTMAASVKHFIDRIPTSEMEMGDIYITNDPWLGSGHKYDMTIVTPVFTSDRFVGFSVSVGHVVDVGGSGYAADAVDIFEEGINIPVMRLAGAGTLNAELLELLRTNVRAPSEVIGDIMALVSCNQVCSDRIVEFLEEYELDSLDSLADAIFESSEQAFRSVIGGLADGTYRREVDLDGVGEPLTVAAALTVSGSHLHIDFEGTSPQVQRAINVPINYTRAYAWFALSSALAPEIPHNEGTLRCVTVSAPEASVLNARFPAPVMARHLVGYFVPPAVLGCLAQVVPDLVAADCAIGSTIQVSGVDSSGDEFVFLSFVSGGFGARPASDGPSTLQFPASISNTPVEVIESTSPLFIEEKGLRPGSAGAGRHRGGFGQVLRFSVRTGRPFTYSCMMERMSHPPQGLLGGLDGACNSVMIGDDPISDGKRRYEVGAGTQITYRLGGGAGLGPPEERDPLDVLADFEDGLIDGKEVEEVYRMSLEDLAGRAR